PLGPVRSVSPSDLGGARSGPEGIHRRLCLPGLSAPFRSLLLRVPPEVPVRRGSGSRSPFFLSRCHHRTPPRPEGPRWTRVRMSAVHDGFLIRIRESCVVRPIHHDTGDTATPTSNIRPPRWFRSPDRSLGLRTPSRSRKANPQPPAYRALYIRWGTVVGVPHRSRVALPLVRLCSGSGPE